MEVLRTVRLLVTTVQVLTRIVRVVRWLRVLVETVALQTNRAELERATATTTTTAEKVSSVGEATVRSLGRTTMREPIAVTTQNIHTREKLLAGLTVASAKTEKRSRRRITATTVSATMEKLFVQRWLAPTGILMAGAPLWAEPTLERSVFSRSRSTGSVILTARPPGHMMGRPGALPRWTTRVGILEEKETGVIALLEAALLTMEGVGARGEVGAAARHPVEEERGPGGGLALVETVLDQRQKVSVAS